MMLKDYYEILGVNQKASAEENLPKPFTPTSIRVIRSLLISLKAYKKPITYCLTPISAATTTTNWCRK